jgi:two-component system, cell cycle response regulator
MIFPSILIADDDVLFLMSLSDYLQSKGYLIDTAENAEQALAVLKSKKIDVVITDIKMDGMDGLEMTRHIKDLYEAAVIVITGYTEEYSYEEAIGHGADDIVFKPFRYEEMLLRLQRVFKERGLAQERERILKELKALSITDGLTGVFNSRHFYHQLEIEIERYKRHGHPLSLIFIDIDHFKKYNDSHGHLEGDRVLRETADLIASCIRKMDSVYRYGGEEFTVILPQTDCSSAMNLAQRIRKTIEAHFLSFPDQEKITVSIGVTEYATGDTLTEFIHRADKALYMAKESGRNRISWLPGSPNPKAVIPAIRR